MMRTLSGLSVLLTLAACQTSDGDMTARGAKTSPSIGSATLRDAQGIERGSATVNDAGNGNLKLTVAVTGVTAGARGIHIHAVGQCDAPGFTSAGGHWNPAARQHGRDNPAGAHAGDLPNIAVGADGRGALTAMTPGTRDALMDADGAAIIIHAAADDYRTDPSGNSGTRQLCGVFARD
jgi:superoxide dismutase, Cu-Zn family